MARERPIGHIEEAGLLFFTLCLDIFQLLVLPALMAGFGLSTGWVAAVPVVGQIAAAGFAMFGVIMSLLVDLLLTLFGMIFIFTWFWTKDLSLGTGRFALVGLTEVIPILNYLPALTIGTWLSIRAVNRAGTSSSSEGEVSSAEEEGEREEEPEALTYREQVIALAKAENRSVSAEEIASLTPSAVLYGEDRSQEALDRPRYARLNASNDNQPTLPRAANDNVAQVPRMGSDVRMPSARDSAPRKAA